MEYPKQVIFILIANILLTFVHYNLHALSLDDVQKEFWKISEKESKAWSTRNWFSTAVFAFPLISAILADNWFGKYKTLIGCLIISTCGILSMTLLLIKIIAVSRLVHYICTIIVAVGYGGAKSCKYAILGDQLVLPQERTLLEFFFYAMIFLSHVGHIFGELAFSYFKDAYDKFYHICLIIDTLVAIAATITWLLINKKLKHILPKSDVVVESLQCIFYALAQKFKNREKVKHWLDFAEKEYEGKFVQNVKDSLNTTCVFLPIIFFRLLQSLHYFWIEQGQLMNDHLNDCVIISPSLITMVEHLSVLAGLLLLWFLIFPWCAKCNYNLTLLRCMSIGMICAAVSFFVSGFISYKIEKETLISPQKGECHLRFFNPLNCTAQFYAPDYIEHLKIQPMSFKLMRIKIEGKVKVKYNVTGCENTIQSSETDFMIQEEKSIGYYLNTRGLEQIYLPTMKDGSSLSIRNLVGNPSNVTQLMYKRCGRLELKTTADKSDFVIHPTPGLYTLNDFDKTAYFFRGGFYVVLVLLDEEGVKIKKWEVFEIVEPNQMSIFWQTPQFVAFALAECFILPTSIAFAYTQTPDSLKTTMIGIMYAMKPLALLLFVIISCIYHLEKKSSEQFLYATLTMVSAFTFIIVAVKYKYVEDREEPNEEQ